MVAVVLASEAVVEETMDLVADSKRAAVVVDSRVVEVLVVALAAASEVASEAVISDDK